MWGLVAANSAHPNIVILQRQFQRFHFINMAAKIRAGSIWMDLFTRKIRGELCGDYIDNIQAEFRGKVISEVERFIEMIAGIDEEDGHVGGDH